MCWEMLLDTAETDGLPTSLSRVAGGASVTLVDRSMVVFKAAGDP
jgi:hypothetical protein